jgi:hypothetical protein
MEASQIKRGLITVLMILTSSFAFSYASASASPIWTVPVIHAPMGSPDNGLNISALNCISKTFCIASGDYEYQDSTSKNLNLFSNYGATRFLLDKCTREGLRHVEDIFSSIRPCDCPRRCEPSQHSKFTRETGID